MAMGSQQLADDYGQLKDLLELYPNISIIKVEGQPPDNYEIEFKLRGFSKDANNDVVIGTSHRVRISLPFGYPHFAPIAKPLTAIFHPDIDPAAIRVADRWQQNPSLPDLVLFIGEMISGNIYNLEDPFNQEAATWYKAHKAKLPLDSLSIADIEESDDGFNSLVDDTFASLGLETDDFLAPEKPVNESDIQHIRDLVNDGLVFTANRLMTNMSSNASFPDREELQQNIGKVLRKADQLFKLVEQLEDVGKLDEAMEVVDNINAIAADAPGIEALRSRIQQSYQLSQEFGGNQSKETHFSDSDLALDERTPAPPPVKKSKRVWTVPRITIPFKPILFIALALGLSIGAITIYFKDQSAISQSQASLQKSQRLIEERQFEQALETLENAKNTINDLSVLRFRKTPLLREIETVIASQPLQEGLKGRVLYQGEFIPVAKAVALDKLAVLTDQAQSLSDQNKIIEALTMYRQALKFATDNDLDKAKIILSENIKALELKNALKSAEKAEQGKNWSEAAEAYRKALALSKDLTNLGSTSDITHKLTAAIIRHEFDQSKKAFTQSQWQETITYLENAQKSVNDNPEVVSERERQDLHRLLVNARLYQMLSAAREAYQQKNWDPAITEYQNALDLLANESVVLSSTVGESVSKIETTLLMVKIAQIQDKVLLAESSGNLEALIEHSKSIQQLIRTSKHSDDPSVKTVMQKVSSQIDKNQEQLALNKKIAWLEEHAEEIFRANYPTFQGSKLMQPKATYQKKVDAKLIFVLTCIERSQGSSSKLELNYMYDESDGKWGLYSGK